MGKSECFIDHSQKTSYIEGMLCKKTTRDSIIKAAKDRFLHYGYPKTTMAEIACDCNMSPGNLYRYFPGKLDIAFSIAQKYGQQTQEDLRQVVRDKTLSCVEKLKKFHFTLMRDTFHHLEDDPKIYEIAQILTKERPEFANEQIAQKRALMVEILSAGNASGEFRIKDVVFVAEMLQSATMKFAYPQLWTTLSLEKLERELSGVLDMVLGGLLSTSSDTPIDDSSPDIRPAT